MSTAARLAGDALRKGGARGVEAAWLLGEIGEFGRASIIDALSEASLTPSTRGAVLLAAARLRPVPATSVVPFLNSGDSSYGKLDGRMYTNLATEHPIDLCRYQVLNCFMGRAGLINSGGASAGTADLKEAVITAIINKRAGGMGLISGRKAFQKPMADGVKLLNAIQDVYLEKLIDIA